MAPPEQPRIVNESYNFELQTNGIDVQGALNGDDATTTKNILKSTDSLDEPQKPPPSEVTIDPTVPDDKSSKDETLPPATNPSEEPKNGEPKKNYFQEIGYQVEYLRPDIVNSLSVFEVERGEEPSWRAGLIPTENLGDDGPKYPIEVFRRYRVSNPNRFAGFQQLRSALRINSPFLINALESFTDNLSLLALLRKNFVQMEEPYQQLVFHLDDLRSYKDDYKDDENIETTVAHIDILLDFLDKSVGLDLKAEAELRSRDVPLVSWKMLWTLFQPGTTVVTEDPIPAAYIVKRITGGSLPPRPGGDYPQSYMPQVSKVYTITCWGLAFDGLDWIQKKKYFEISRFTEPQVITSLPIYPLDVVKEPYKTELLDGLKRRGKIIYDVHNESPSHKEHNGWTLEYQPREIQSRVVIDNEYYFKERGLDAEYQNYGYSDSNYSEDDYEQRRARRRRKQVPRVETNKFSTFRKIPKGEPLTDLQLCLLPEEAYGWILKDRKWAKLNIRNLKNIVPDKNIFDSLILPEDRTEIIKALVQSHKRRGLDASKVNDQLPFDPADIPYAADAVKGKGQGLLILLHGPPGVGKTSTAECVAEYTERPLFPITCGDLGTTPNTLEENLDVSFRLAQRWGAVLLLDEADVFLERRGVSDIGRNSLVSVFLRILEYYTGILFLTTNRVGSFDEAFTSRLHVSIHYPPLEEKERTKIWKYHVERVERIRPDLDVRESVSEYLENNKALKKIAFNGRQIRNIFQTAVSLAFYEAKSNNNKNKPSLRSEHLKKVIALSCEFQEYLDSTREPDSLFAENEELRNDGFKKTKSKPKKSRNRDDED